MTPELRDGRIAGLQDAVIRYHDGTKHQFGRFARSLGYLDWASQPRPFRAFAGSKVRVLHPAPDAPGPALVFPPVSYDRLFVQSALVTPITPAAIGDVLRHALGLTAWKVHQRARWSLRANPSSGNLHPTEAYVVAGSAAGLADSPAVWHYAPDRHVLEQRAEFDPGDWNAAGLGAGDDVLLVALTSIHWREAWKYGERAFRYCQHDLGHAIAALSLAAALHGWRVTMARHWSHADIAGLVGIDRNEDFVEAEHEEPACLLVAAAGRDPSVLLPHRLLAEAVRRGRWCGHASQLSEEHVQWTFIDEVAHATVDMGQAGQADRRTPKAESFALPDRGLDARRILLQRRSALAFDGASGLTRAAFLRMLQRTLPQAGAPWDAMWWPASIHLALFVHRVVDVEPGLYLLSRSEADTARLRVHLHQGFQWEPIQSGLPLFRLHAGDYRRQSMRISCDQDIAADGFFSLGMIADFDRRLSENGAFFYRHLFWESGVIGQVLYLEAEAAGARATGIGCFFDDPMHDLLGLEGHAFQSLYHFTVGAPVDDGRLTTEPGYAWERP